MLNLKHLDKEFKYCITTSILNDVNSIVQNRNRIRYQAFVCLINIVRLRLLVHTL